MVVKGNAKFGGKSGILPEPRQIFKQPFKKYNYKKEIDTGYAKDIQHPKGTTRDLILPKVFSIDQRLKKSAAEPKKKYDDLSKLPIAQQYKIKNAELRRKFLKESYIKEANRLDKQEKLHEKIELLNKEKEAEALLHESTEADLLTAPTVESYLNGPLIRPRTEEEIELLQMKRRANYLNEKLKVQNDKAIKLFELYNSSSNFAITDEALEVKVENAFSEKTLKELLSSLNNESSFININSENNLSNTIKNIIVGKNERGPTYSKVEDTLSGFQEDIIKSANELKFLKETQAIKELQEKEKILKESN